MKVTEFFMRRPTLFWSLMAGVIVAGVIAFVQMPKLEDPVVAVKQAMVVVPYPGASAHEAELNVAIPMEDALRTLPDVKKVRTECANGSVAITVEFLMSPQQFGYYNAGKWMVDSGDYQIKVGASSADIRLSDTITLTGDSYSLPLRTVYFSEMQPLHAE